MVKFCPARTGYGVGKALPVGHESLESSNQVAAVNPVFKPSVEGWVTAVVNGHPA